MSGVAGASIGLTSGAQKNIADAQTLLDGMNTAGDTAHSKGCTTNFIGFGLGASNEVQTDDQGVREDFGATDDTITLAVTGGDDYVPTYTSDDLTWPVEV